MAIKSPGSGGTRQAGAAGTDQRGKGAFSKALGAPGLTLLTIGGVMGSGLFVASGMALRDAGPAILVLFGIGLLAMSLEINALAEMSAADPTPGSFLVYCRRVLGPGFSFVTGWIYWLSSVLTMSSEVTAAALLSRVWFPAIPLWAWSAGYCALIVAINFIGVRGFGEIEGVMAGIKTLALVGFVALGVLILTGVVAAHPLSWQHITGNGGILPGGIRGAGSALLLVLFAYAGTGVIGMAAAETRNPARTIPRSVRTTIALIAVLYLGSIAVIVLLLPWAAAPTDSSPFVAALRTTGLPALASLMNLVLLLAVLSTMNAALYANVRVLYSLAKDRQAPPWLGRLNGRGVPARATWASAVLLGGTVILAYLLPHQAYTYLVTATGFQAMFIWLMVLVTHLYYRPYLLRHKPDQLKTRLFGYPYTTLLPAAIVLVALGFSLLVPKEAIGALVGALGIAVAWAVWLIAGRRIAH